MGNYVTMCDVDWKNNKLIKFLSKHSTTNQTDPNSLSASICQTKSGKEISFSCAFYTSNSWLSKDIHVSGKRTLLGALSNNVFFQ